eukprot:7775214-Pyramimonas_sp.AAC.1
MFLALPGPSITPRVFLLRPHPQAWRSLLEWRHAGRSDAARGCADIGAESPGAGAARAVRGLCWRARVRQQRRPSAGS